MTEHEKLVMDKLWWQARCEACEDENAKLRELVMGYHKAMVCCLQTGMWPTDPKWLEERMRELGVVPDESD